MRSPWWGYLTSKSKRYITYGGRWVVVAPAGDRRGPRGPPRSRPSRGGAWRRGGPPGPGAAAASGRPGGPSGGGMPRRYPCGGGGEGTQEAARHWAVEAVHTKSRISAIRKKACPLNTLSTTLFILPFDLLRQKIPVTCVVGARRGTRGTQTCPPCVCRVRRWHGTGGMGKPAGPRLHEGRGGGTSRSRSPVPVACAAAVSRRAARGRGGRGAAAPAGVRRRR